MHIVWRIVGACGFVLGIAMIAGANFTTFLILLGAALVLSAMLWEAERAKRRS